MGMAIFSYFTYQQFVCQYLDYTTNSPKHTSELLIKNIINQPQPPPCEGEGN